MKKDNTKKNDRTYEETHDVTIANGNGQKDAKGYKN